MKTNTSGVRRSYLNVSKKSVTSSPKEEKNIDDLMTQIDKLKKEVEEIKNQ